MLSLNEKFTLLKTIQERDAFGSVTQVIQEVGEKWCCVVKSDGFFHHVKGGKKRVQILTVKTWLNREIDYTYFIRYNGVEYNVVNAMHSRVKGITTIQCEFNK